MRKLTERRRVSGRVSQTRHPQHDAVVAGILSNYRGSYPDMGYFAEEGELAWFQRYPDGGGAVTLKAIAPERVREVLAELPERYPGRTPNLFVDDRGTASDLQPALAGGGWTPRAATVYLAHVGDAPHAPPVPGLTVEPARTPAELRLWSVVKLQGFADCDDTPEPERLASDPAVPLARLRRRGVLAPRLRARAGAPRVTSPSRPEPCHAWAMELTDTVYDASGGIATITINRPEVYNAFRGLTVDELIHCFKASWADRHVGVVILTGAGDRAFCSGGDQKQRAQAGGYGPSQSGLFEIETLHRLIRDIPKPVIAAVNGFAIGGGHVLHVLCDLTIASTNARFGQVGPRVGSFDAGFGTAYLARILGEKRAREVWYLCRQYTAEQMRDWGLVNEVVDPVELIPTARAWATEILAKSPTAIRFLKHSFNADSESIAGISQVAFDGLGLFVGTDEAGEGVRAFSEKRDPDFGKYR